MTVDISIVIDPISDVLSAVVVVILIKWIKFDKKQAKKRGPRKRQEITVLPVIVPETKENSA